MKVHIKNPFLLPSLIAALGLILADRVAAQTFTTLHSFAKFTYNGVNDTNSDGVEATRLSLSGNTLYGTTVLGSTNGVGTLFALNTNGTGFTTLYTFSAEATNALGHYTNSDGTAPDFGLILSGNTLYGTANGGGTNGTGTVFALNTNGSYFTTLHYFSIEATNALGHYTNSDGIYPDGLILSGNTLYGTANEGGTNGTGTVFAVNTNGTGFTNLHTFAALSAPTYVNSDGAYPSAGLLLLGATLYGAAESGGTNGAGTLFALNTNGTGFTNLHYFAAEASDGQADTNSDGMSPNGGLILVGNALYGTTYLGGTNGYGTVFSLDTNGTGFTTLHTFTPIAPGEVNGVFLFTNSDGIDPNVGLLSSGNTLFGTGSEGGTNGEGTLFALNTNGTDFTIVHAFTTLYGGTNSDGAYLTAGLLLSGNTLYGAASQGGSHAAGTVFSLSFVPQLAIFGSGTNVVLTWPANVDGFDYTGFILQSTTNLVSPAVWNEVSPAPVVVNGQFTVTNSISGTQMFYRLDQ